MKLLVVILTFSMNVIHAASAYSQSASLNLDVSESSIRNILTEIEKQTGCTFFYSNKQADLDKKVSLRVNNAELAATLDKLFTGTTIYYVAKGNSIILRTKEQQQKIRKKITGVVLDSNGDPIIGASVTLQTSGEGKTGVITDVDGKFSIEVPSDKSVLDISYIGYKSTTAIAKSDFLTIKLHEDNQMLNEVVVVGYGTQRKESVVGSVQMIKPAELKTNSSNLSAGFAGRLAGVVAMQRSGEPGADGADFWIRGISTFSGATSPLIIIDGVQASSGDLNALDPEVIESFSILKDATATALYGTRGANGVMIVNTKSGRDLEKAIVNMRLETSYSAPTQVPNFVGGVPYMELFNEAVRTRKFGDVTPYSNMKIAGTRMRGNPYVFPNVDWYDELFHKGAFNQNFNFNVRGGAKKIDYFSSVSVNHESGVLKSSDDFSYNNNVNVMRYVFQNNINAHLTKTTNLSLHTNINLRDYNGPSAGASQVFGLVMEANPVDFPIRYPNDSDYDYIKWGGKTGGKNNNSYRNPYAEMARGYQESFQSTVMANLKLDQKLDFITPGLSANALLSFKNYTNSVTKRSAPYNQFEIDNYTLDTSGDAIDYLLRRIGTEQSPVLGTDNSNNGDRRIYIQAMINYDRTFKDKHNVSGMLLFNQDDYSVNNPGSSDLIASLPQRKRGFAGRFTYAYDSRYLFEANFGYNGSENFAKDNRWGFFPSFAAGYVISREKFFEKASEVITNLKIKASWGLVGNDQIGGERFIYLSKINLKDSGLSYTTGRDQGRTLNGPKYSRYANPNMTWEVGNKWNVGLEVGVLDKLNFNFDIFKEIRSNIFLERQTIPDFMGLTAKDPWINLKTSIYGNLGKVENKGFDGSVDYNQSIGKDWNISVKGTFTYASNKILEYDEPGFMQYPNLSRIGHSIDQQLLYIAERLFIDDAEVLNSPLQKIGGYVNAGDIKYRNLPDANGNYDDTIDTNDRRYTGHPTTPEIVYGFGPSIRYKNWDFSVFFQGVARTSIMMKDFHPFGTDNTRGVQDFIANDYWSEGNQNIYAAYPRLSKKDNANTSAASTFWQRDGSFLKLKNAEIGYNHKLFRVYLRGTNLLTFSKFKHWDPEQGSGNGMFYPTQRVINLGIQLTFNK